MLKPVRIGVLGLLLLASCVVRTGPAANAPPQQPIPPPQAYNQPAYVMPGQATPATPNMPPAQSARDPMNLQHLQSLAGAPRRCNLPLEVAPGYFTHVDCYPYRRVGVSVKHASPLKIGMMQLGQFKWNPMAALGSVGAAAPALSGLPLPKFAVGGAAQPVAAGYPDTVDHRLNGTEGPIKDQGDVGACTAFGLSSVLDNSFRRAGQNITTSPEHIWSHYAVPTMEDAASGNLNRGITTFEALPYSGKEACELMKDTSDDCGEAYNVRPNTAASDTNLQNKLRTADASNGHRAVQFEELEVSPPNINEIVATLASGADLWVAFNISSLSWSSRSMNNFLIPDWGIPDGGHAVAMAGYRKVNGSYQFLIHNSWGTSWGDKGYAWVSQAMVQQWLHLAYKIRTDVDATPVTPKTDEDCAGDQVLDSVTNKCAPVCPDKSRPANGQCAGGQTPTPQSLQIPGLPGVVIPGIPAIPGWGPAPQPTPNQPNQPPAPNQAPVWPWPVPSNLPPFIQLPH